MRLVCRFIPLLVFIFAVVAGSAVSSYAAPKKTDAQIDEQKNALKKLEVDLAKKREELAVLETEEKGVLNTISLLDQNLNRTRSYLSELTRNEDMLQGAVKQLVMDIDSLDSKIKARKRAMRKRIRNLYVHGRSNDAFLFYAFVWLFHSIPTLIAAFLMVSADARKALGRAFETPLPQGGRRTRSCSADERSGENAEFPQARQSRAAHGAQGIRTQPEDHACAPQET